MQTFKGKKVYICDPAKNCECRKTICHDLCFHTLDKKYRAGALKRFLYWVAYHVN